MIITCKDFPPLDQNTNALIMNFSFCLLLKHVFIFLKISVNFKCVILDFQYSNFIVEFKKREKKKKKEERERDEHLCSREQKVADAIKEKRRNRMTEASVDDVIVLTYDVTACMCVNVHASVFICVPVCVTLSVVLLLLLLLRNAEPHFFRPNFPVAVERPESRPSRVHINL